MDFMWINKNIMWAKPTTREVKIGQRKKKEKKDSCLNIGVDILY